MKNKLLIGLIITVVIMIFIYCINRDEYSDVSECNVLDDTNLIKICEESQSNCKADDDKYSDCMRDAVLNTRLDAIKDKKPE